MASPHFVLFPYMAQGHMIPMIDLAKLLAQRGAIVTLVTTPKNAARNDSVLARAIESGLQIKVVQLEFPWNQAGLPEGCENLDLLPSLASISKFNAAASLLYEPSVQLLGNLSPRPACVVSDMNLPWTLRLARHHRLPRLVFYTFSCFFLLSLRSFAKTHTLLSSTSDEELVKFGVEMMVADQHSDGVIFSGFEEMEPEQIAEYRNERKSPEKVWCVGPVSLCNDDKLDVAQRGNRASIDVHECVNWMDGQHQSSVVYISLGSLCNVDASQLIELGLGLEASNKPFIWVIRELNLTEELLNWLEEYDLVGRTKGRGLVIRGWAPQMMILSHSAIGCFLTHCGWNSSMEGVSAGVPMITWPLFADQMSNGKLIVEILKIGVSVGVDTSVPWGEEEKRGVLVRREKVREAIEMAMDGEGSEEMRQRCKQLAEKAKRAVQEGGSSNRNLTLLMDHINGGSS
ncbi:UDP-glycosyltransferase 73C6-like [Momordica charantia]|uniref:Glycosyltransferase n=1 Tax=Momordica charantia TaxID=3673 RepID=A0A6J1CU96_MOMCH|nr:UDP-glycosyltransferase 73C6-like [Momordica charantia]